MEFIATAVITSTAESLQQRLTIAALPRWCASVEKVLRDDMTHGEIYSVWGAFDISREIIRNGVRFALTSCPMAFQWTITTGHQPNPADTVIHCSINRTEQDPDFVESMRKFVADWKVGLERQW